MHAWTSLIGEELILEAEYGNEHSSHAVAVMNDGFVVSHVPILFPHALGIYSCHSQCTGTCTYERCHTLCWYPMLI